MNKRIRKDNPIAAAPPPIVERVIVTRKVQKGGAISIGGLRQGTRVNLLQISEQTFLVSALPPDDLHKIAKTIPSPTPSPYAAISARVQGMENTLREPRIRTGLADTKFQPPDDAVVIRASNRQRTTRMR